MVRLEKSRMSIAQFLEPITASDGAVTLPQASNWMQGRTLYGGASALIAFTHAMKKFTDLPVLRSAQIGFVAPVGEDLELTSTIVRQGRNVTQLRSEIHSDGKLALTAFWLLGAAREANAKTAAALVENWPAAPEDSAKAMAGEAPSFISNNFDIRHGQAKDDDKGATIRRWARLTDEHDLDPISRLVLMGDVMPPGAMRIMQRRGPISSINWSFNVLDPESSSQDGWYLAENSSQYADAGYSSERLRMWNTSGQQVLDGLQCVAIFG